jgi:hypothetical protein
VRTSSVPADHDVIPEIHLPAQTSGLDWSGSMEAGPTLIGRRRDEVSPPLLPLPLHITRLGGLNYNDRMGGNHAIKQKGSLNYRRRDDVRPPLLAILICD